MRLVLSLIIIFFGAALSKAQSVPLPSEFQSWNDVQFIVPLARGKDAAGKTIDKATATFTGTLRVGRSDLDLLDRRAGVTVEFRLSRHFSVLAAALYRKDELTKNVRRYETRLDGGFTVSKTWRGFTFRDRNMFERRVRSSRADLNLYRNRVQINYPLKINKKEIFSPFISEEGYYDLQGKTWITNEFFAGVSRRLNERATLGIAYIRADTRPTNVNGLSLNLKLKLR